MKWLERKQLNWFRRIKTTGKSIMAISTFNWHMAIGEARSAIHFIQKINVYLFWRRMIYLFNRSNSTNTHYFTTFIALIHFSLSGRSFYGIILLILYILILVLFKMQTCSTLQIKIYHRLKLISIFCIFYTVLSL